MVADLGFARTLRSVEPPVHLTSHHFARYGPLVPRPYVVTVHDLIRHLDTRTEQPLIECVTARDRALLALDRHGILHADACIAVSAHTKREVVRRLGVPPRRVTVVPHGLDHDRFHPRADRPPIAEPYVLFVGSEHPRKNLPTLLRAFARVRRDVPRVRLVKVGAAGTPEYAFRRRTLAAIRALSLEGDVVLTGRVADDELPAWYSGALCLALPSLHEGFGLPVIEAMACGCPVIVSSAAALPEVAGGAALVVDPLDEQALAQAIVALISDAALRRSLRDRGRRRVAAMTLERTARATRAVYAAAVS